MFRSIPRMTGWLLLTVILVAVIAIVGLGSAVVFFVRRIWKPIFEAEDVARRLATMCLRIVAADAVDQAGVLQRPEMVVQG